MGSVRLGLRSLVPEHQRERLRQTASDKVCVWQLRSAAQLQTDPVTAQLNILFNKTRLALVADAGKVIPSINVTQRAAGC